jgi:molybdenum cofactor cytidylyltransferase
MEIEGIVLAAGFSSRAGTYKMTLKIGEATVIEKCIEGMYDLCSRIIVVGGFKVENIFRVLGKYPKVEIVLNKNYEDGMFSSLKEGFRHVRGEAFFFTPGDYPLIGKKVYEKMAGIEGDIIIPVFKGIKGHPVLMKGFLAGELLQDSGCTSLRAFIDKKGFKAVEVQEPGILEDIDTIDDYDRLVGLITQ